MLSRAKRTVAVAVVVVGSVLAGLMASDMRALRPLLGAVLAALLALGALRSPRLVLPGLVAWLALLGLVRRLVATIDMGSPAGDPLLLVGAVAWSALAVVAVRRGALKRRTPLTSAALLLGGLLTASAVNPLQGGLAVGLGGVLLTVVPMLAFLVGRAVIDERLFRSIAWLLGALSLLAAGYGLFQTFIGFPSWDESWIERYGYGALNVRGATRAFSSFTAASEYGAFLGAGIVVWVALGLRPLRVPVTATAVGVLSTALWFEASRGIFVMTVLAVGLVLAARAGAGFGRSMAVGLALLAAIPSIVTRLAPERFGQDTASDLARHQVEGLTDPFNESSTLHAHVDLAVGGITSAFRNPVGSGVGSVTIAGAKFGGGQVGAEADPGNAGLAAGVPGLAAYTAVAFLGLRRLYALASSRRDPVSLAALGFVIVTFLQWLNGGNYAVAFLPWLAMGWSDRITQEISGMQAARAVVA